MKLRAIVVAPVLLAAVLVTSEREAARKCGTPVQRGHNLVAIDGVVSVDTSVAFSALKRIQREDIYSVEVLCMNPQDSSFSRSHGLPIVSVWTKSGPVAELNATLTAIVAAQDAFRAQTSKYAGSVAELQLPATRAKLQLTVEAYERGWVARGTMPRFMSTCTVFDGDVVRGPSIERRKISCQ